MTERTNFHPQWVKNTKIIPASHPREASTVQHANARIHIVLDDYQTTKPVPNNALTLILTHGTSFSRVFWEAIMADLVSRSALDSSIKRIIAVDAVNHGDSAVYNTGKLSSRAFWPDISRDILTTLNTLEVSGPIVGIGHSFGGGALLHAAMMASTRFTATILVEPILFQMKEKTQHVARLALRRRDCWHTLEDVVASFRKAFHDWDLNQLDRYIHDCTRFVKCDNDKGYWTLKTPKEQEAATYLAAPYPRILELLDQSLQRHYFILGGKSKVIDVENREKVKRLYPRPGSVAMIPDAGHLLPISNMGRPKLIFGAVSFGMNFIDPENVQGVLDYLKENNFTNLDTAGRYPPTSPGRSEELIGATKAVSQGFTVDTKILTLSPDHLGGLERSSIEKSLSTSLQRMGVEQVNTLYIHFPDMATPLKEQAATFDHLYKAGKFMNLGVSNFQPELLQELIHVCESNSYIKPTVYQGDYSAVNRGMEKKLLPILKKHGIGYNAFRVLASGFLSGKLTNGHAEGTRFGGDSPISKLMQSLYNQESLHTVLKQLEETTRTLEITTIDAALRWAYYHSSLDENDGIILGASSVKQLKSNIESIRQGPLPQECLDTFERIWETLEPIRRDIL